LEGAIPVTQQDTDDVVSTKVTDHQIGVAVQVQVGCRDIFGTRAGRVDTRPVSWKGGWHYEATVAIAVAQQYDHSIGIVTAVVVVP